MTNSGDTPASDTELSKSPADIRSHNVLAILKLLFPQNQLSRAELGRRIGVSRMAISDITKEMCDTRLLTTVGLDTRTGRGKRSSLLAIDTTYWRIIGVDISQPYVLVGGEIDLAGNVANRVEIVHDDSYDSNATDIIRFVSKLLDSAQLPILGIVITVPGVVDADGAVALSVRLGWQEVPLGAMVQQATGIPVLVGNALHAALAAEYFYGRLSGNSLLVRIGMGVGASLCINGEIVQGANFTAGEIGHITIDPAGPKCGCGKKGCLEVFASDRAIRARLAAAPERRLEILSDVGKILGRALSMPVALLDLRHICLDGLPDIVGNVFLEAFTRELDLGFDFPHRQPPRVWRCQQLPDRTLKGQTLLALPTLLPTVRSHFQP